MKEMSKKRILFVDDEQKILDGLKRMLHGKRQEWEMEFIGSGTEALKRMKEIPFTLIVSDMRMPEMDGAELLKNVKKLYPQTIRFILSGYSDKDMILRTLGPTDQFLVKPINADALEKILSRALDSLESVKDKDIRAFVSKLESLPTIPELYKKLKVLLESSTSSFSDIAKIISQDVSMTAKILQLVNSSFFGLRQKINNIQYATTYLGIETIRSIVLLTEVFSQFTKEELTRFSINKLYKHSIAVGFLTAEIIKTLSTDPKFPDISCMAGTLHDIGKIIFIKNKPEEYKAIYQRRKKEGKPLFELEKEHFGVTHAKIGAYLMGLWNLPEDTVKAISYHHDPSKAELDTSYSMLLSVHVSNVLERDRSGPAVKGASSRIDKNYLIDLNMHEYLPSWREIAGRLKSG